jgi:hypothetical protein
MEVRLLGKNHESNANRECFSTKLVSVFDEQINSNNFDDCNTRYSVEAKR